MARIITWLGQTGQRAQVGGAVARWFAQRHRRVLVVTHCPNPALDRELGAVLTPEPQEVAPGIKAVQLQAIVLLEQLWEELKALEARYVKSPFFRDVYGQELSVFPGLDSLLTLNALRGYRQNDQYDVILYDGASDRETLCMMGVPTLADWYYQRFTQVLAASEFSRNVSPFVSPLFGAMFTNSWDNPNPEQPKQLLENLFRQGQALVNDPQALCAYLVTSDQDTEVHLARWWWGSAQQVNVRVQGVLLTEGEPATLGDRFAPLPVGTVENLLDFDQMTPVPPPLALDLEAKQIQLFLPGFSKSQVKLTQYGPGLTIEAGDQRRNITLPSQWQGQSITGARFHEPYLTITF
ncbi:anion-transporting ATPase [Gloeomargarita lithophora Alchichica-D10]|uniref:Anion-transporting ATPase n=1 Tax=Gloeomargarita lithophora Alchichica-D10 TaxID=1188229 RepID=A0A1J0AFH2_9CYAN|nr:ArsA family ATPase [Gloeomargarita lithophora]APB34664.1 anion-transporting ATPase [Gloeomargarita lithophora Alchichica-D10]